MLVAYCWKKVLLVGFVGFVQGCLSEGIVLFNDTFNTFLFTVIWCWTYGKGPLKKQC